MRIQYICHSSFFVELSKCALIFDYYGEGKLPKLPEGKKLYFLNSHRHPDHFRQEILGLREQYPQAEYLLSRDIRLPGREQPPFLHFVKAREEYVFGELRVRTLRSTDEGVAFVAETEGRRLYHAGDLNWWHWEGEEKAWNNNMAADYQREISRLEGQAFDAAFVPLDPRLGNAYSWGMQYFLLHTRNRAVFPMHCWGDYEICKRFQRLPEMKDFQEIFHPLEREGQEWILCW